VVPPSAPDLATWLSGIDPTILNAWIIGLCTAFGTVLAVIIAARYAYRHARDHNQRAHTAAMRVEKLHREIDALERIWGLLAYMTFGENDCTIVHYREDKEKNRTYYIRYANLQRFVLGALRQAFYTDHAGLHIPTNIRDMVFDYNGSMIGLYLRYEKAEPSVREAPIAVKNAKLIDKLRDSYDSLNQALRDELQARYEKMSEMPRGY
jgi:hypothetical protein